MSPYKIHSMSSVHGVAVPLLCVGLRSMGSPVGVALLQEGGHKGRRGRDVANWVFQKCLLQTMAREVPIDVTT